MAKKVNAPERDFTSVLESMFTVPAAKESYYLTQAGNVIAGIKNNDGILQQARYHYTNASTPAEFTTLMNERQQLASHKVRLEEIPTNQYSAYNIPITTVGGGPKTSIKRPKKVSAGSVAEESNDTTMPEFLKGITDRLLENLRTCITSGGNPYESYDPNFTIFKQ